ncbi:MAG: cobalamin B12-binding domain-containing protein [Pseudomonadota bacterium]
MTEAPLQHGSNASDGCTASTAPDRHKAAHLFSEPKALVRAIEDQVIPHLLVARRRHAASPTGRDEVAHLTRLLLEPIGQAAEDFVAELAEAGRPAADLMLDLLAPSARRLGVLWDEDVCSFSEVTIGTMRLHRMTIQLSESGGSVQDAVLRKRRALLCADASEQHVLGLRMVAECLGAANWEVVFRTAAPDLELSRIVRANWFELIGITVGGERSVVPAARLVRTLRKQSRNSSVYILAGGPILCEKPEFGTEIGADAVALDAREAVTLAERVRFGSEAHC